jgi:hypothetical protein
MSTQVITIQKNGTISGLERKQGQGVDIKQFGEAEVLRSSEVLWDSPKRAWYVSWLNRKEVLGEYLTTAQLYRVAGECISGDGIALFTTYEDAVEAEIKVLDYHRIRGLIT